MKKHILIALLFSLNFVTFAQNKAVKLFPQYGQGFLALYRNLDLNIAYWTVDIAIRTWENDSVFNDKVIDKFTLTETDYMKVPEEYLDTNSSYVFTVKGYKSSGEKVITDGPNGLGGLITTCPGCDPWPNVCKKKCNGKTYAWQINQLKDPNNSASKFDLGTAFQTWYPQTCTGVPYYQYMNYNDFMQIQTTYYSAYYNILDWGPGYSPAVITIPNDYPQHVYYNAVGGAITTGLIYGVQKYLGNWKGDYIETPILQTGSICSYQTQYFIDLMNGYANVSTHHKFDGTLMPELSCNGTTGDLPHPHLSDIMIEIKDVINITGNISIDSIIHCLESDAIQSGLLGGFWPEYITGLSVGRLDKKMAPVTLLASDLFGPDGEYLNPNFTLEPGLYSLGLVIDDGSYLPIYREFKEKVSFSRNQSEFLNASISPVPIEEDNFNLHMEANATLSFEYILYDFSGNIIYKNNFIIPQYQKRDFVVIPKGNIPSGMLLNKFIFEDGSQINIQTIKN